MKKLKTKALVVVMALLVAILPMSVFAATGLNSYEEKLLDDGLAALGNFTLNDGQADRATSIYSQIETYLNGDFDLTAEGYETCKANLDTIQSNLPADLSNLSISELYKKTPALSSAVAAVADALDLNIDISGDGNITIKDKSGNDVGGTKKPVQQTGADMTMMVLAIAGFAVVVGGCGFAAKKMNLFAK